MTDKKILKEYYIKVAQIKAKKLTEKPSQKQIKADKRAASIEDRNMKMRKLLLLKNGRKYLSFYNRLIELQIQKTSKSKMISSVELGLLHWDEYPLSLIESIKNLLEYNLINWNANMTHLYVI